MKLFHRAARPYGGVDRNRPVDKTAGDSTALLTQTAGAIFGLMPALMAKAAHASAAQADSRDANASNSAADHNTTSPDVAHVADTGAGVTTGAAHGDVAAAMHKHDDAQAPPHAPLRPSDPSAVFHGTHFDHPAASSSAPQPLHLPDTSHDIAHSAPANDHGSMEAAGSPAMQVATGGIGGFTAPGETVGTTLQAAVSHVTSGIPSEVARTLSLADHAADNALHASTALLGATGAQVATLAHDADALVAHATQAPLDVVGDVTGSTLGAIDQPVLQDALPRVASAVEGAVHDSLPVIGRLADAGSTVHQLSGTLPTLNHEAPAAVTEIGQPAADILDAAEAIHAVSPLAGSTPSDAPPSTVVLPALGTDTAHLAVASHDVSAHIVSAAQPATAAVEQVAPVAASPVPASHEVTPAISTAGLPHSASNIGHAAASTSDGLPLHVPLIGQSYMDHDAGHDAGFSLHALHGI